MQYHDHQKKENHLLIYLVDGVIKMTMEKIDFGPTVSMEKANGKKIREKEGVPSKITFEKVDMG